MVASSRANQKADLEKIAAQLASVKLLVIPGSDRHLLRANVKFATLTFDAGAYKVSVGLRQAALRLDHPSYELDCAYQATLPKEIWSESWKNSRGTKMGGRIRSKLGAKFLNFFSASVEGSAEKNVSEGAEQKANAPYRIVSASPSGWQIGTELGDPRDPEGTLPVGLEHCLNGVYLSGRSGEHGEGLKEKNGAFALCELIPKPGGNDPKIVATLVGMTDSLQVEVRLPSPTGSPLRPQNQKIEREEKLRKAFIEICLQRAEGAAKDGARTEAMLSGEFYLSHHEIHGPIKPVPALHPTNRRDAKNENTVSKARSDAKHREP
jgi:hypothetical protein